MTLVFLTACAGPAGPGPAAAPGRSSAPSQPPTVKRITAAVRGEARNFAAVQSLPGGPEVRDLLQSGLGVLDDQGRMQPQLAETVPSIDNKLWTVSPDGSMETTWRIKSGARWHDGTPVTADDLVFTTQVGQDEETALFGHVAFAFVDKVTPVDERTVVVAWKRTYIFADQIFSSLFAPPLPRHILQRAYAEERAAFSELPYWSTEFISTGPFKLTEWVAGSHLTLTAFADYVAGKPSLDEVRIAFIPDPNTLMANILADAVDVTLGRSLSLDQAIQVREQWRNGKVELSFVGRIAIVPQFINPNPAVIANLQFRRALVTAIDRQEMADSLQNGLSRVADSYLNPNQAEYREIENLVTRYPYDLRRASDTIAGLGYTLGPDGAYQDASGQRLAVEARTSQGDDLQEKALFSTADAWRRVGVGVETVVVPSQRQQDREYRATRPGFEVYRQPDDLPVLADLHGSQTPLPENSFAGRNRSRYQNAEFDALLDRYFVTIPPDERVRVVGQIISHISDQLTILGLFYNTNTTMISSRLGHASADQRARITWNAHQWDVTTSH